MAHTESSISEMPKASFKEMLATCLATEVAGQFDVHPRYMEVIQGADIKTEYRRKVITWVKRVSYTMSLSDVT